MDFCGQNKLFPEIDIFSTEVNNQYQNIIIITITIAVVVVVVIIIILQLVRQFVTSANARSLSTKQFVYLYRTARVMPWISFKIYF